jgi:small subunit ribosomal protein S17e
MSRIRTKFIKSTTRKIWRENSEKFTKNFGENKKILDSIADVPSKKLRNMIAGYLGFMKRREEKEKALNE